MIIIQNQGTEWEAYSSYFNFPSIYLYTT